MDALSVATGHLVVGGVLNDILVITFRSLFFLSAVLLMAIVLLQEGKGGGLASALGGQGAETFGVSSGGVNKVTLFLAGVFLVTALGHALAFDKSVTKGLREKKAKAPIDNPLKDGGKDEDVVVPGKDEGKDKPKDAPKDPPKEPVKEPAKDAPPPPPKDAPKDAPPKDGGK